MLYYRTMHRAREVENRHMDIKYTDTHLNLRPKHL